mmetsp:Transcript_26822/g.61809  ORF Transcript_26822/g.61809 Transcript_26822/m.61809 type:complete len:291 (+) Transcript_26822:91-963(+)|eukprot:CAMPEP_0114556786 /NCGR_PEP_ID=MMETSP0114-20121206/9473_1 /TAXON_ID=31324 /ORGANISM="Goniomonas sp, Strain m" /LENGTH=290 /DNA_ID=CAMNT_0001742011 /DNA_START=91 /DNA_END=963 /DNA_ORIENTATION=+
MARVSGAAAPLDPDAKPSITLPEVCSTLQNAVVKVDLAQADLLFRQGHLINETGFGGKTPLHLAVRTGSYDMVYKLLTWGANVNALTYNEDTPLHEAAVRGHADLVQLLIDNGAWVNPQNKEGYTPLLLAAENYRVEVLSILMAAGADARIRNLFEQDSLALAKNHEASSEVLHQGIRKQVEEAEEIERLEREIQEEKDKEKQAALEEKRRLRREAHAAKIEEKKVQQLEREAWVNDFWKPTPIVKIKWKEPEGGRVLGARPVNLRGKKKRSPFSSPPSTPSASVDRPTT